MIYLGLLVLLAFAVLNFLFGDYLIMSADGLVVRDRNSIEATFLARVESVDVKEGQTVRRGEPLFRMQSSRMLERLADLSARRADLAVKATDFQIRAETVTNLLPLATRRESETLKVLKTFEELTKSRLVTSVRYDEALQARYQARESLVRLQAQEKALNQEISTLVAAIQDAAKALGDLREHYGGGVLRSPVDGSIGASVPFAGDVYQPGETILAVYSGKPYVLAYLPRRYLFSIHQGMEVRVKSGQTSANGVVTNILPVTDTLPNEFQKSFRPQDRNQLARIKFEGTPSFPLHEKVEVTGSFFGF